MLFKNLEAELKRSGMTIEQVSKAIHIDKVSFYNKMNNKTQWKLREMLDIQSIIEAKTHMTCSLDYLFKEQ